MKFSECNPALFGLLSDKYPEGATNELVMDCPQCKQRFSILVKFGGGKTAHPVWGLTVPSNDWDQATITPSIANHPVAKGPRMCHFSVINGEIRP